jgi:phosphoglucosamine mutase
MSGRLFGTDGVRGKANVHPMTAEIALALGQAIAHVLRVPGGERRRIIIGKDTRLSGYLFEDALAAGICAMGVDVLQVGPIPTPGMAFLAQDMRCHAGVMISASHNPYQDNGIKFFASDGFKLPDAVESEIERLIASGDLARMRAPADQIGQARRIEDAQGRYVVFLKNSFPSDLSLDGLRIVLDCAHGASYRVGPTVFRELGAEVFTLGCEPDGRNINEGFGSLHPERTAARVREVRADIGIALDGDADRVVLVTDQGQVLDGDDLLATFGRDLAERGTLRGGKVVGTVMTNLGLEKKLAAMGVGLLRTPVGDRYVVEAMRAGGYNLGGEQSGHLIFLDYNKTGDGLITALQALALMRRRGQRLSEVVEKFQRYPQVIVNVAVKEKKPIESLASLSAAVKRVETEFNGSGRVLIRYSGTEPKARVMVEGADERRVEEIASDLADELRRAVGAS